MRRRDSTATSNFAPQFQGEQMSSRKCKQIQRRDPKNSQKDFQRLPSSLSHAKAIDAQLISVSLKGTDHDASVPLHLSDLGEVSPSDGLESDRTIYELAGRGFSRDTDLAKELQEATENGFRIFSRPEIKTQADQSFMLGLSSLCDLEKKAILEFLSLSTFSWDNLQESSVSATMSDLRTRLRWLTFSFKPSVQAEYTTQSQFEGRKARGGGLVAEPRADGLSREELNEIEEALLDEQRRLHRGLGPHQVRRGFKSTRAHHATFDTVPCSQRPSIKIPSISMVHSPARKDALSVKSLLNPLPSDTSGTKQHESMIFHSFSNVQRTVPFFRNDTHREYGVIPPSSQTQLEHEIAIIPSARSGVQLYTLQS